jgi:O-antigen ligase
MKKSTMNIQKICDKIIEYSFYTLFLLVPLVFTDKTSELYELNKMWLVWGLTVIIGISWFTKMILQKKNSIQKTPLDIPIILFLVSQTISTVFSLDQHVSLWGYYSRFNGGLLSIISYIFLYYAFLSNFQTKIITIVKRLLSLSLISGLIVALWGLPSHFGYDPTCFIFRGTLDVSCWTADFVPKIRIFSTLGQPDWLAAYLAILIPISLAYVLSNWKLKINNWKLWAYLSLTALFYIDLLYTRARSGFIAIWISLILFVLSLAWIYKKQLRNFLSLKSAKLELIILASLFIIITFFAGSPISFIDKFTFNKLGETLARKEAVTETKPAAQAETKQVVNAGEFGGTDSGKIRLLVWSGAINAWKSSPIFGTGVETFAYAYYKHKPVGQNLTSEWDFLYNKAHNEYLNYLTTTGLVGLGTYLLMIGYFLLLAFKQISKSIQQNGIDKPTRNLILALLAAYISILITNFFGFSVVMTNIYLFIIPAFVFILAGQIKAEITPTQTNKAVRIENTPSVWQLALIFFVLTIGISMLIFLLRFWQADKAYALGYNLDQIREYQKAYTSLHKAVELRGNEPVFKDELSINDAIMAAGLISQESQDSATKDQTINVASSLAQEAINTSNEIIAKHPNNVVFWKTRVRVFYTLSQVDSRYLPRALDAIEKASLLAPNDARIWYNLGVLYGQNENIEKGISAMEKVVMLKPNYRDAYYALGLFYHTAASDESGKIIKDENLNKKAIAQMEYILSNLSPEDKDALESIEEWSK